MQDLSCSMQTKLQHAGSLLCHAGSGVVAHRLKLLLGMWDLSSLSRDGTLSSYIARRILNHWTTSEVPVL